MPRRTISQDELFELAIYLAQPHVKLDIHAELPAKRRASFEEEYKNLTDDYPLPPSEKTGPYFVWAEGANKWGLELRLYISEQSPMPPVVKQVATDFGKWYIRSKEFRINNNKIIYDLFECGFVLGESQDFERIQTFMARKFPSE